MASGDPVCVPSSQTARGQDTQTHVVLMSVRMTGMNTTLPHPPTSALSADLIAGLQAIAEPTRANIIALLGHGEHCVCDVGDTLALSPALVSHHLRVLRVSGLLRERRSGRWVYYSLDLDALARLRAAMSSLLTPTDAGRDRLSVLRLRPRTRLAASRPGCPTSDPSRRSPRELRRPHRRVAARRGLSEHEDLARCRGVRPLQACRAIRAAVRFEYVDLFGPDSARHPEIEQLVAGGANPPLVLIDGVAQFSGGKLHVSAIERAVAAVLGARARSPRSRRNLSRDRSSDTDTGGRRRRDLRPALCCPTGLCGPVLDTTLVDLGEAIVALESEGRRRHPPQMTTDPQAFMRNREVYRGYPRAPARGAADHRRPWPDRQDRRLPDARRAAQRRSRCHRLSLLIAPATASPRKDPYTS